ncbi:MAG: hypothetical protein KDJ73_12140 [Notoacmeibacter sp.]|nr:hypothetical protein [Notoacmeibacter sp.]
MRLILESATFARSERARDLLAYLVEKEQAGEADRLKGFAIGVDVFGKDSGFDPSTDAVVRVQAGRLRQLLDQFYAEEAPPGLLRIGIPRGSYIPAYCEPAEMAGLDTPVIWSPEPALDGEDASQADEGEGASTGEADLSRSMSKAIAPERIVGEKAREADLAQTLERIELQQRTAIAKPLSRHFGFLWIAMAVVIGLLTLVTYMVGPFNRSEPEVTASEDAPARRGHRGAVSPEMLPNVSIAIDGVNPATEALSAAMAVAIPSFEAISLLNRPLPADASMAGSAGAQSFRFVLRPGLRDNEVQVTLESVGRGSSLWSGRIHVTSDADRMEDQLAGMLSATVADQGVIYHDLDRQGAQSVLARCIILNARYYAKPEEATHRPAFDCFRSLADAGAKSAIVYSELAVLILEAVTDKYAYPPDATPEKAIETAETALQYGPQSAYARRAMGYILSRSGNVPRSIEWAREAHELNRADLSLAASYGYSLVFTGKDFKQGAAVLQRAVDASTSHAIWWDYGLFIGKYMSGDAKGAFMQADRLVLSRRAHYRALRLIAAYEQGNTAQAAELIAQIRADTPEFAANPAAYYLSARYPGAVIRVLVDRLSKAGLTGRRS